MEVGQYLQKYQTAAYKLFKNAFEKNRLSHAYLLIGEQGIPLKEIALFLAKSLVCENPNPLACEHCINCYRVDEGNYADIKLFDGKEKTIKKSDISNLTETFSKTAIEEKGVVIYILNNIENMTVEATNSLLKFLEEPSKNIYAILTSENESKILPTIISRTQRIALKLVNKKLVISEAIELGVPSEDSELLSNFYNSPTLIKEKYQDKSYLELKKLLLDLLFELDKDFYGASYYLDREIIPVINDKEKCKTFLDMLFVAFNDINNLSVDKEPTLNSYKDVLVSLSTKLKHIDLSILEIMKARNKLDLFVSISLLLSDLLIKIVE